MFNALGVTFDLSCSEKGQVVVRNKESRVLQICEEIDAIMNSANMPPARATSLRGRLQFAETHTFNRILASNLRVFQSRACGKLPGSHLTPEIVKELQWAKEFMVSNKPRTLRVDMATKRILLFTDASLERDDAQGVIGMVAYVMSGDEVEQKYYFSEEVPQGLMRAWQERTPKIIATLELFAAVVAMSLLAPRHPMTRVFCFVDNEAARATLISFTSPILAHNALLRNLSTLIIEHSLFTWVARVPSKSNPADDPSRLVTQHLTDSGFTLLPVDWPNMTLDR